MSTYKKPKVMIIDDSQTIVDLISRKLSFAGFEAQGYTKSLGILVVLLRERPDLILLDIEMPFFNGPEICKLIKQSPSMILLSKTPILFYSSMKEDKLQTITIESGADGYIHKNWELDLVITKIKKMIPTINAQTDSYLSI